MRMTAQENQLLARFRKDLDRKCYRGGFYYLPALPTEKFRKAWKILQMEYALDGRKPLDSLPGERKD
jgi:hypothetical protein